MEMQMECTFWRNVAQKKLRSQTPKNVKRHAKRWGYLFLIDPSKTKNHVSKVVLECATKTARWENSLKWFAKIRVILLRLHIISLAMFSTFGSFICLLVQLQSKLHHVQTQVAEQQLEITMVCLNIIFLKITISTELHWTSKHIGISPNINDWIFLFCEFLSRELYLWETLSHWICDFGSR